MCLYELKKNMKIDRQRSFIFSQMNKFKVKIYSNLPNINICYYLKDRIAIMHRQFFKKLSQNPGYVERICNNGNNPFHFACRKWYVYNNPQC